MRLFLLSLLALLGVSTMATAQNTTDETSRTYTYDFTNADNEGIDISSLELGEDKKNATLVSTASGANNAIAYFTESSVTTTAGEGDGVLELYGAKSEKKYGPYAGNVNSGDETTVLWTSGKTQGSGEVWYDYFKVNVPEENIGQYITISADYISGSDGSDRYLVVDQTLSDISSEEVEAINAHLASSVSSGQAEAYKATTTYYGTEALKGTEAFYLIASNNVGVYSITVTFSTEAPTETSTTVAVAEPEPTEIDGYLTVAMGSNNLLENEETTIVVTEDADAGTTTVAVPAELPIDLGITTMTVTDLSVTFTADANGEFTDGVASFSLSNSPMTVEKITGTFVTADGVTTFESKIPVYGNIAIEVSFTTEAPVVEEWTLITSQFDQTPYIENDGNSWLALSASALSVYEYVALDVTVDLEAGYSNFGALLTAGDYDSKYTNSDYDQTDGNFDNLEGTEHVYLVFSVATLTDACTTTDGAIPFVFWGNTLAVSVYGSADYDGALGTFYPEAEAGETSVEWKLASQSWGANWSGTTWTGVSSEAGVLELTTTVGDIMTADGVEELGGINFQVWNVADNEGTTISWTFTVTTAESETVVTDAGQGVIGTDYEVNEYGAITLGQYCTSICYGTYTFATTDVVNATVTIVGDIVYNAISDLKSDIEAVEVARYNLMGQKLSGAEKGINIIVYSDGSAKKVLVK